MLTFKKTLKRVRFIGLSGCSFPMRSLRPREIHVFAPLLHSIFDRSKSQRLVAEFISQVLPPAVIEVTLEFVL